MKARNYFFKPAQQTEQFRLDHSKASWSSGMAMGGTDLKPGVRPAEQVPSAHTATPTANQHPTTTATQSHVHRKQYCHLESVSPCHLGGWALLPGWAFSSCRSHLLQSPRSSRLQEELGLRLLSALLLELGQLTEEFKTHKAIKRNPWRASMTP